MSTLIGIGSTVYQVGGGTPPVTNDIGIAGAENFGVGVYPTTLPSGFSTTADFGNYQYSDGSIMVWVPAFFYKIVTNTITVKPESAYANEAAANADGYALHRAFKDGGSTKRGFFVDKYQCSNNSGTASAIKNGNPLSSAAAHNPFSGLTGAPANTLAGAIDAVNTRGSVFACCSRFIYSALALLSVAHGQAANASTYCAWYDGAGATNYPKGCNNNALGDTDDGSIVYTSDGYSQAGKTGSGLPFAKTMHNGQASGVADINGNMWEVSLGMTRPGSSASDATWGGAADFYVLKESVAIADLTSGWDGATDAWGNTTHLATLYDVLTAAHLTHLFAYDNYGNGANQVLSEALSGNNYSLTGLGLPKDASAQSVAGTNLFGTDGIFEVWTANLCVLSGGNWSDAARTGVWAALLRYARPFSDHSMGFRAAMYV